MAVGIRPNMALAKDAGVEKSAIIDGRVENCILLELFTQSGVGTEIVA